ncbi:hypothetical protein V6N13_107828 [Hibiscus sabdariffa]|uniref:Uncharacterized protein n=1 Tax=Hibiscus sabdariffa TaxID=183260 RepID=A0ABR2SQK9_9ROSI
MVCFLTALSSLSDEDNRNTKKSRRQDEEPSNSGQRHEPAPLPPNPYGTWMMVERRQRRSQKKLVALDDRSLEKLHVGSRFDPLLGG